MDHSQSRRRRSFAALFIAFLVKHGRPACASTLGDLKPALDGFRTAIGIPVSLWGGFKLSKGASEEIRNPKRDVPKMIVGAGIIAAVVVFAILIIISLIGSGSVWLEGADRTHASTGPEPRWSDRPRGGSDRLVTPDGHHLEKDGRS